MAIILTYRTFLTYALDYMTSDEVLSGAYFLVNDQVKYTMSRVNQQGSNIVVAKSLWPTHEECFRNPDKYYEYLVSVTSTPRAGIGQMMACSLAIPVVIIVPEATDTGKMVHTLQKFLFQEFGIGSMWFDGLIYEGNPNIYKQDDEKVMRKYKEHTKMSRKNLITSDMGNGMPFRQKRLGNLNRMSETEQRQVLKEYYDVNTDGMDRSRVYAMMLDLYVNGEEDTNSNGNSTVAALRARYKKAKRERKFK